MKPNIRLVRILFLHAVSEIDNVAFIFSEYSTDNMTLSIKISMNSKFKAY